VKVLWHSNALWAASGYGKQTKLFAPRLAQLGHKVAVSAFWGLEGARMTAGEIEVYPRGLDTHGNDVVELHAENFFGGDQLDGLVLPLTDIWVMNTEVLKRLNTAGWVPVDHEPCQPPTVTTLREGNVIPIAMSRFGERMLKDEGFDPLYVPHGVDTNVFQPLSREECRRSVQLETDAFIVGMVAANQGWRKSYPQAIRAFKIFYERHPDAILYLHTWLGSQHMGVELQALLEQELPVEAVRVCDQYRYAMGTFPDDYLAQLYSSMDVLLNPSQGEGFGVPIIEAQACGVPVILTDCTSMTELCGSGALVGGTDVYTQFKSWQKLPDVEEIVAALEYEYGRSHQERLQARRQARDFAVAYDADVVTSEFWVPALAEIEQRIAKPKRNRRKMSARV
jgi:glycosyltransferase involved in cell wall biosynthesis